MQEIARFEDVKSVGGQKVTSALLKNTPRLEEPPLKIRDGPVLVRWFHLVDGSKGGEIDAGGPQKVILFDNTVPDMLGRRVIQANFALAFRSHYPSWS